MPTASNSPTSSGCASMYFSLMSRISVVAASAVPGGVSKRVKNMLWSETGNISLPSFEHVPNAIGSDRNAIPSIIHWWPSDQSSARS